MPPPHRKPAFPPGSISHVLAIGGCNTFGIHSTPNILDKFCRCLEQAGHPVCGQTLDIVIARSPGGVALMSASKIKTDILLLNFGHVDPKGNSIPTLDEFRAHVRQVIKRARQANPAVWILLWGSPPMQRNAQQNEQLLRYNAELHDIATRMGANYLPTKPVIDNLSSSKAWRDKGRFNEAATTAIAAEMAHAYLSQRQRTAA